MFKILNTFFVALCVITVGSFSVSGQEDRDSRTPSQRLQLLIQRVDSMERSINSAISAVRADEKGKKKDKGAGNLDSPLVRLSSIKKDLSNLDGDIRSLRAKVDRSEKYESEEIVGLEERVAEIQPIVDRALGETASARMVAESGSDGKKKGKFLGIFGRGSSDEFEELLGGVAPGRDRELFVVATREVRKGSYEIGRLLFQTIITTYGDSRYLPMAKLAIADSFFLEGGSSNLIQAAASYQDWLAFFPTHPLADRVLLKIAESEMRQIGLPDRDSTRARRAEIRLKALISQYPNSILREEAQARLREVQDNLALHNLFIGNYYYKLSVEQQRSGLKGAQNRYREILDKYPDFSFMDEALYKLAVTYLVEEETDQAAVYFQRIVRDYPNSEYVERSKEQLQIIGAAIPEPDPTRTATLPAEKQSFFTNFKAELLGIYPLTIDKNGVLMTKKFDRGKFELIDQIIENQGEIFAGQIPQSLTTIISERAD
jgi:outer membrane protein assembly factor BamD